MSNRARILLFFALLLVSLSTALAQQPSGTTAPAAGTTQPTTGTTTTSTQPAGSASVTTQSNVPAISEDTPLIFWISAGVITLLLLLILFAIFIGLTKSPTWFLGEAISEEAGNQPNPLPIDHKPVMVASSSRLIALLGLMVILVIYLGFGYCALWRCFTGKAMLEIRGLLSFLFGGASMFAPYMVNQLKEAFSSFAPAAQAPGGANVANPQQK
jgi:hypothetical protein